MKKYWLLCVFLFAFVSVSSYAQSGKLPPFRMMQANGKTFKAEDLPMGKPIVVIYFSPDCDHCANLMKAVLAKSADLKMASVAMVTYLPVNEVIKFATEYNLSKFSNIYVGTEGNTYFLKNYYKLTSMPFLALYTKMGDLVKTYPNENGLSDLLTHLKALP